MISGSSWLTGNWWQILSALALFGSYVAVLARAVYTIKEMEKRVEQIEAKFENHLLSGGLHRSIEFETRVQNIEVGLKAITDLLTQVQIDLGILLKQTS